MNIGREDSLDEQITALQEKVSRAKRLPWTASSSQVEYDQQRLNDLQEKKRQKDLQDAKEQAERNYQEQQKRLHKSDRYFSVLPSALRLLSISAVRRPVSSASADMAIRAASLDRP